MTASTTRGIPALVPVAAVFNALALFGRRPAVPAA